MHCHEAPKAGCAGSQGRPKLLLSHGWKRGTCQLVVPHVIVSSQPEGSAFQAETADKNRQWPENQAGQCGQEGKTFLSYLGKRGFFLELPLNKNSQRTLT